MEIIGISSNANTGISLMMLDIDDDGADEGGEGKGGLTRWDL